MVILIHVFYKWLGVNSCHMETGHGLESHPTDWRGRSGSKSGTRGYEELFFLYTTATPIMIGCNNNENDRVTWLMI